MRLPSRAGAGGAQGREEDEQEALEDSSVGSFLREVALAPPIEPPGAERDRTGETVGHFELTKLLGRGGMGVVYAAFDRTLRREVALKLLRAGATPSEERRRRFLREARSGAAVRHPNIAAVFEAGEIDGEVFLVMERVEGRSLRAVMNAAGGALPTVEAAHIAREMARGLAAAHAASVIHRDIKPENVMIGDGKEVKILDFGLAKLRDAEDAHSAFASTDVATHEGRLLGTTSYMSPEQARGLSADARSDVFALGVVLFEMLAGARPFRGATTTDVLAAILRDAPPPLPSRGAARDLASVVMRCLAKEPSERYADAGALLAALEAAPLRTPRRPRMAVLALPVAATALIAAWFSLHAPPSRAPEPSAPSPAPRPTAITDLPLPSSSSTGAIDAYKVALQAFRDANWGQAQASLRKAIELDPTLAAAHLRLAIVLSPPGRVLRMSSSLEARAAYREATRLRGSLTPRDRALLSALEPMLGADPPDMTAASRKLAELGELSPGDAEIFHLCAVYALVDDPSLRLAAARRAVEIDPGFADAWQALAQTLAGKEDLEGAMAALERCAAAAPMATDCWFEHALIETELGRCADAEAHLRRATSDPQALAQYFRMRASMLYALGKPREAVAEVLRQVWPRLDPTQVAWRDETADRANLAAAYGDFEEARAHAREGLREVDGHPALTAHAPFALLLAEIELETGRVKEAAAVATDFLRRHEGWQLGRVLDDPSVYLSRIAARGGAIAEGDVRARRDAWYGVALRSASSADDRTRAWDLAYVAGIEREDEALEALSARPTDVPRLGVSQGFDAGIGRVLWLGGKREEAHPFFERAFRRCSRFEWIMSSMRADLLYGRALEARGAHDRACQAFARILARWGEAKPRSVTAEEARKHARALGCDAGPP
ncbi:serine/threonine-protein kinase [Polyangium mundeleinium]|uniref:Protein kinase n=1 Tax=Polyangium mundeleinium TaxID=2995306 RepID=A0ABT5EZ31_9BACT|nr:serine/threonine-protein kinase [Polyangium mundeleinium]MDC0747075.1 protein kinase [Polyangium mundeleinium]